MISFRVTYLITKYEKHERMCTERGGVGQREREGKEERKNEREFCNKSLQICIILRFRKGSKKNTELKS